eukprot:SAG31_NODE_3112_length_4661_cov_9.186760_3_plen_375_part_00
MVYTSTRWQYRSQVPPPSLLLLSLATGSGLTDALFNTTTPAPMISDGTPLLAPAAGTLHMEVLSEAEVLAERRRRRLQSRAIEGMQGSLEGNVMPLGYFYTRLHIGTPGQVFTVIVDTGSSLTAIPCSGCSRCGSHMDSYFRPEQSSTFTRGTCNIVKNCQTCSGGTCMYRTHFVEGSSISGFIGFDKVGTLPLAAATSPDSTFTGLFGCQQTETGMFKSQLADGIMGVGHGQYPTLLESMIASAGIGRRVRNTLTFCVGRSGGYIRLGGDPPSSEAPNAGTPRVYKTPLMPSEKYYFVKIIDMQVGSSPLDVGASVFNSGGGVLVDSGTSLIYLPRSASKRYREVFKKETHTMNLGKATQSVDTCTAVRHAWS